MATGGFMDFKYENSLRQSRMQLQKLALTPDIRQSLELLELPLPELKAKLTEIMLENPVLEYGESEKDTDAFSEIHLENDNETYQDEKLYNRLVREYSQDDFSPIAQQLYDGGEYDPYARLVSEITFTEYLFRQLCELKLDAKTRKVCEYIINDLDDRGFTAGSMDEISDQSGFLKCEIEKALGVIRQLQPTGVGAANLQDCLMMQLDYLPGECPNDIRKIVRDHIGLLADNKMPQIALSLGVTLDTAREYCNVIRSLNPIPSSGFQCADCSIFTIPEAEVKNDKNGGFMILLNESVISRLQLSPDYLRLTRETSDKDTLVYLKNRIRQASSVIRAVKNRGGTIRRIIELLIQTQRPFFESGKAGLNPMTVSQCAEMLSLNESTVSRAVSGKYILCPFGDVSLKSFFTSKIPARDGDGGVSSSLIRQVICEMINAEDKLSPLSDQGITTLLQRRGFDISRRTVAKYRGELMIPSASGRRSF